MTFISAENRIYQNDGAGNLIAEVTFPQISSDTVEINHTFVDDSLRGQGIAGQLLSEAAALLRRTGRKANPTCSYAVKWFEKNPEFSDILAKPIVNSL